MEGIFFIFFLIITSIRVSSCAEPLKQQDNCLQSSTSHYCSDPIVRFPFRYESQPEVCGYGQLGFQLSCQGNQTILKLPLSQEFHVDSIDYESQRLFVKPPDGCLARSLLKLNNLSTTPFQLCPCIQYWGLTPQPPTWGFSSKKKFCPYDHYKIFNCSSSLITSSTDDGVYQISCLRDLPGHFYAIDSKLSLASFASASCGLISPYTLPRSYYDNLCFQWDLPDCRGCRGGLCRSNGPSNGTECVESNIPYPDTPYDTSTDREGFIARNPRLFIGLCSPAVAVMVIAIILLVVNRNKKEQEINIERFLNEYRATRPTRYSYADIKRMTGDFKTKLGQGGYGSVFKGKLLTAVGRGVPIAVKVLEDPSVNGEEFINEVGTIGRIHHINIVRLFGFCVEGSRRALIYEFMPNESLEKFIFVEDGRSMVFSWTKLQEIAMGIAQGIDYLHQGCDHRIVHFDIKPHNILLDHKFTPKISDFGLSKLCSKEMSIVSMTAVRGTMGYIAPEVFLRNSNMVSHKSDVYSFGMLLLEMVGGRKNTDDSVVDATQIYFPEWIYARLEGGEELGLRIEGEDDVEIARRLTVIALWCIQWNPVDRPSIRAAIQMLEGTTGSLTLPPNPFTNAEI